MLDTQDNTQESTQDNTQESTQESTQENARVAFEDQILHFCEVPRSKKEIAEYMGYKDAKSFGIRYLAPMLKSGRLEMTIPDKPKSRNQKYIKTKTMNRK